MRSRAMCRLLTLGVGSVLSAATAYADIAPGAVYQVYFNGSSWATTSWQNTDVLVDLARNYGATNYFFGANANGGISRVVADGSTGWQFQTQAIVANGVSYTSLANGWSTNTFYAARATGGIDQVSWNGSAWQVNSAVATGNYVDLAASSVAGKLFAARADGGIDSLSASGGTVQTTNILANGVSYVSICQGIDMGDKMFAARADGGIDQVWLNGSTWESSSIVAAGQFVDLAEDYDHTNFFYGSEKDGSIQQISYYAGAWHVDQLVGPSATPQDITLTGSGESLKFFATVVPEPAAVALLGGGMAVFLMCRRERCEKVVH